MRSTEPSPSWSPQVFPAMLRANCEHLCSVTVWEFSGSMSCEWGGQSISSAYGSGPSQPLAGMERHYCSVRDNVGGEVLWNTMSFGTKTRQECDASCRDESTFRNRPVACRWGLTTTTFGVLGQPPSGSPPSSPPPSLPAPIPPPAAPAPTTAACTLQTRGSSAPASRLVGEGMIRENCALQCEIISQVFGGDATCVWGSTNIAAFRANAPRSGEFCSSHESVSAAQPWNLTRLGELPNLSECSAACAADGRRRRTAVLCTFGATSFTIGAP